MGRCEPHHAALTHIDGITNYSYHNRNDSPLPPRSAQANPMRRMPTMPTATASPPVPAWRTANCYGSGQPSAAARRHLQLCLRRRRQHNSPDGDRHLAANPRIDGLSNRLVAVTDKTAADVPTSRSRSAIGRAGTVASARASMSAPADAVDAVVTHLCVRRRRRAARFRGQRRQRPELDGA